MQKINEICLQIFIINSVILLIEGYAVSFKYSKTQYNLFVLRNENQTEHGKTLCHNYACEYMRVQEYGPNCELSGHSLMNLVDKCCEVGAKGCNLRVFNKYFCETELCEKTCQSRAAYAVQKTVNEVMDDAPPLAKEFFTNIISHVPALCKHYPDICTGELEPIRHFSRYLVVRVDLLSQLMIEIMKTGIRSVISNVVNPMDPRYQQFRNFF